MLLYASSHLLEVVSRYRYSQVEANEKIGTLKLTAWLIVHFQSRFQNDYTYYDFKTSCK